MSAFYLGPSNHDLEPDEGSGFGNRRCCAHFGRDSPRRPDSGTATRAGFIITDEQRAVGEGNIQFGHIDGIVRAPWNAHHCASGNQTSSPARFEKLQDCPGGYRNGAQTTQRKIQTYLHFLPECASALVVVLDRGSLEIYAEEIFESGSQWKAIEKAAAGRHGDVMPPRPEGKGWTR